MAGYWPSSFFCVFMNRDEVEVHKLAKKNEANIQSHLDRTNLVNKGFIIWLLGKFCLRDTAGSPERARWLRSGSQSQRAIWFILPARGTSHIISNRMGPDRWLEIVFILPRLVLQILFQLQFGLSYQHEKFTTDINETS